MWVSWCILIFLIFVFKVIFFVILIVLVIVCSLVFWWSEILLFVLLEFDFFVVGKIWFWLIFVFSIYGLGCVIFLIIVILRGLLLVLVKLVFVSWVNFIGLIFVILGINKVFLFSKKIFWIKLLFCKSFYRLILISFFGVLSWKWWILICLIFVEVVILFVICNVLVIVGIWVLFLLLFLRFIIGEIVYELGYWIFLVIVIFNGCVVNKLRLIIGICKYLLYFFLINFLVFFKVFFWI